MVMGTLGASPVVMAFIYSCISLTMSLDLAREPYSAWAALCKRVIEACFIFAANSSRLILGIMLMATQAKTKNPILQGEGGIKKRFQWDVAGYLRLLGAGESQ